MNLQNTIISAKVLNQSNKLFDIRIDFRKSKFSYVKGEMFELGSLTNIEKIGTYTKDYSKLAFIIASSMVEFLALAFVRDFLSFLSTLLSALTIGLVVAYTFKLFRIHAHLYRIYLNNEPLNLLLNDLDAYTLKEYINAKETA